MSKVEKEKVSYGEKLPNKACSRLVGIRRDLQAFSTLGANPSLKPLSRPAHQRLTQTVRRQLTIRCVKVTKNARI